MARAAAVRQNSKLDTVLPVFSSLDDVFLSQLDGEAWGQIHNLAHELGRLHGALSSCTNIRIQPEKDGSLLLILKLGRTQEERELAYRVPPGRWTPRPRR